LGLKFREGGVIGVKLSGFRAQDLGFRVQGSGLRFRV
jgi:hypothetical protein